MKKVPKSEKEWMEQLTPEQYNVLRQKGTEESFTGQYVDKKEDGTYTCAGCGQTLFSSKAKYDSKSGWPSFFEAVDQDRIKLKKDTSLGMERTEVICSRCGSHLGHVFNDGPKPTGKRYCINSLALDFKKKKS